MAAQEFKAMIENEKAKRIILPFDPNGVWGEKAQHHVTGAIAGVAYRGAVQEEGGLFFIALGPAWLRDAGLADGAEVEVRLEPEGPQLATLAEDIAMALSDHPRALEFFESLPTFYRKNYIRWIEDAKQARTRAARIAEMVGLLAAGQRQR